MKKILVIGNGDSIFVKDFINQYLTNDFIIDLYSDGSQTPIEGVRKQVNYNELKSRNNFSNLYNKISTIRKELENTNEQYDVIIIHFIHFYFFPLIKLFNLKSKKIVGVIWGSDFYKVNSFIKKNLTYVLYKNLDKILFTNELTINDFKKKYPSIDSDKLAVARFGLPTLDAIDRLDKSKSLEWYSFFNLPLDKTIVLVGYNANLYHQQLEIIDCIQSYSDEIIDKFHLIFPLGYGSGNTKELILSALRKSNNISFTILDEFYGFEDISKLRAITDILINIQPTDQFSGSMQETLYAGGWVLTGSWLPYQNILELEPKIILIDSLDEFKEKFRTMIENDYRGSEVNTKKIRNFISEKSSWSKNIGLWNRYLF